MLKLVAGVAAAALWAGTASADIYAVVVGVDAYRNLTPLNGAANDARDIAGALNKLGANTVLLVDEAATRESVMSAFRRQAQAAGPGDVLFFSYAGHGIQEPEALPGDEADGLDETIVFAGFGPEAPASGQRLRDNEIGALLAEVNPETRVTVLIDSCHSGTMTRDIDPRGRKVTTRFGGIGRIGSDPLPKPARADKGKDMTGPNIVFIAAARDEEQIPEVEIDGRMRGAVSWSVARALEGAGDFGGPAMTLETFRSYVRAEARALSAARQTPDVVYDKARLAEAPLVPNVTRAAAPEGDWRQARAPRVYATIPAERGALEGLGDWVGREAEADLIWDVDRAELIDRETADFVAFAYDMKELRPALGKWRAVRTILNWAPRRPLEFRISPGDGRHRLGEIVSLSVERPRTGRAYLTIVNLASDGQVQFVLGDPEHEAARMDEIGSGPEMYEVGSTAVTHPLGADHALAIMTPGRPDALRRLLASRPTAEEFAASLTAYAASEPRARVGVLPIFTTR